MTLLTWNRTRSVGVRAMDDQHGILMDTMNNLRLAVVHGCGREEVSKLLDELIEFTQMHFTSEECLMEKTGFPGLAEHRALHHSIAAHILQSAHRLQFGEGVDISSLLSLIQNGYSEHIECADQLYGQWLNDHDIY